MKVGNEDPRFQKERLEFYRLITVTFVCSVFQIQNHRKIGICIWSQEWRLIPVMPVLGRMRQEDC